MAEPERYHTIKSHNQVHNTHNLNRDASKAQKETTRKKKPNNQTTKTCGVWGAEKRSVYKTEL